MYSKPLSAISTWVALLSLATATPLVAEKSGKFTLYKEAPLEARQDASFFPWPANQSSIVDEASQPADGPPGNLEIDEQSVSTNGQIPRAFIETKCDAGKKAKITAAWEEAKLLAQAQTTFRLGYRYDIPHTQWLGKSWNDESSWIPWRYDYRKIIGDNFSRLAKLFSNDAPKDEYLYWYCYDYSGECTEGVQAYTWDSNGFLWSNHYTVFCDPFYDRRTLAETLVPWENDKNEQKVMENFHLSRGQIMFHEVWHYKNLVSSPRTEDYAYQAQSVWNLAKEKGTSWAYVNADSYALDAVAIYVQQHYKSGMSPVPFRELKNHDAEAAAVVREQAEDNARGLSFTETPPNWNGPLPNLENPDPAEWEEVNLADATANTSTPPPNESQLTCAGVETTKWMGRDALNNVIGTFCADAEAQGVQDKDSGSIQRKYNEDNVDAVSLSMDWPSGSSFKPNAEDCKTALSSVMDNCDGNNPDHNPLNWKHGGVNQIGEVRYNVNPLTERYKAGVCGMHVHQREDFWGVDGPGTMRHHRFYINLDAKDSENNLIGGTNGNSVEAGQGGGNPYVFNGYYNRLEITPQARGDYIQFTIGDQSWTTNDKGVPGCQVGPWDGDYSPVGRDMDCFFRC